MVDRKWNKDSYSKTAGFSSHSATERQTDDYYATEPRAVRLLLEREQFWTFIFEPACGEGHLSKEMERLGHTVKSMDLIDRWYWEQGNFLLLRSLDPEYNIITNPPYKIADEFIRKWLELLSDGQKLALFLPIRYLEGKARKKLFEKYPPYKIHVSSSRIKCAMNWEFEKMTWSAVCYSRFVRIKGSNEPTILERFN